MKNKWFSEFIVNLTSNEAKEQLNLGYCVCELNKARITKIKAVPSYPKLFCVKLVYINEEHSLTACNKLVSISEGKFSNLDDWNIKRYENNKYYVLTNKKNGKGYIIHTDGVKGWKVLTYSNDMSERSILLHHFINRHELNQWASEPYYNGLISMNNTQLNQLRLGIKVSDIRNYKIKDLDKLYIYSSLTKKVVAEAKVRRILYDSPDEINLNIKNDYCGMNEYEFISYTEYHDKVSAIFLKDIHFYDEPRELQEFGFDTAPQKIFYLERDL